MLELHGGNCVITIGPWLKSKGCVVVIIHTITCVMSCCMGRITNTWSQEKDCHNSDEDFSRGLGLSRKELLKNEYIRQT